MDVTKVDLSEIEDVFDKVKEFTQNEYLIETNNGEKQVVKLTITDGEILFVNGNCGGDFQVKEILNIYKID